MNTVRVTVTVAFTATMGLLIQSLFAAPCALPRDSMLLTCARSIQQDSLHFRIQQLQNFTTRYAFEPNRRRIAENIERYFNELCLSSITIDSFQLRDPATDSLTWQYNVIGSIPGTADTSTVLILGAHYDAICYADNKNSPGADDNASGVAAMYEIARVIKKHDYRPYFTLRFIAFAAEEVGIGYLAGSRDYARKAADGGMKIKIMLCLDMLAWTETDKSGWQLNVEQYKGQEYLMPLVVSGAAKTSTIPAVYHGDSRYSDSFSFYEKGYPALWLVENYGTASHPMSVHPFYHTVNDRIEQYNLAYATELTRAVAGIFLFMDDTLTSVPIENPPPPGKTLKPYKFIVAGNKQTIRVTPCGRGAAIKSVKIYTLRGELVASAAQSGNASMETRIHVNVPHLSMLIAEIRTDDGVFHEPVLMLCR